MSTADRAFFAAYSQDEVTAVAAANRAAQQLDRAPATAAGGAGGRRTRSKGVADSGGGRYRLDARHPEPVARPHRPMAVPPPTFPVQTVDIGCFTADADLLSSSLVITPPLVESPGRPAPAEPPAPPQAGTPARDSAHPLVPESLDDDFRAEDVADEQAADEQAVDDDAVVPADPWKPVWEIDGFAWPDEARHIFGLQTEYFRYAGEKLRDASREGLKTLVVVSSREREGSSTLALCLARSVAAAGARIALIDANLRNPELGLRLGLDFSCGWQDALGNPRLLSEAAVVSLQDKITLIPLAHGHRIASLHDIRVNRILDHVREQFDLVIVDAGCVPPGEEAMFDVRDGCRINAAMIVRDVRRTTEAETLATASSLKSLGIEAIGIAENFTSATPHQSAAA